MHLPGQLFVLFLAFAASTEGLNAGTSDVFRKVVCRGERYSFKNVKCPSIGAEQPQMAILEIRLGYLNDTVNCTESDDTLGCEEGMTPIQTKFMLEKGSAQPAMTAVQFPVVDVPKYCKGYADQPDYMAFVFECLQKSNVIEMCSSVVKTGPVISVYNNQYPAVSTLTGTHHCVCNISSPASVIISTLYDYRLNCTGNEQNVTLEDADGTVLTSVCDSFLSGHQNSTGHNLTMVWRGQVPVSGLFWIGFRADDRQQNVTVNCYPIYDPTTTTTTTTTSTTTPTITTKSIATGSLTTKPAKVSSSTPKNQTVGGNADTNKGGPMPKTVIYALAGGGGVVVLIALVICVVVVKRRNNVETIDTMQMRDTHFQNTELETRVSKKPTRNSSTTSGDQPHSRNSRGNRAGLQNDYVAMVPKGVRKSSQATNDSEVILTERQARRGRSSEQTRPNKQERRRESAVTDQASTNKRESTVSQTSKVKASGNRAPNSRKQSKDNAQS